jgi:hypothetical protein
MPIAVPGIARISVVSASIAPRPGAPRAREDPGHRHADHEADQHREPQNRNELMMNLGVSMLTCRKNSSV